MAEENGAAAPEAQAQQPVPPRMQILGQFIRDLSFENIAAQKAIQTQTQPDIQVQVALDARKRDAENQYDVIVKLKIDSKTKDETPQPIFLIEMDYVGIFQVDNVPQEQLHPFLMIECPRMLFPFLRRIVSDITRDGGFPPLNLENMDFLAIYRNELARRAEAQKKADA
ncbi:protein-export chaperone SecB [Roseobacter sp. HKCCD9010]|jgi:preprotein translocase subunit SecB|uniref:protein-export chaperone SecB n=1 Tax=Rhodobacterales TaxID=204455 RepID=UPI00119C35D7|nr:MULTISPECIES: protein-export chaperone SecB [Rhodobacterales]MBF9048448.1 protein-export chaperone SecB [Rhodobacterales bacterium HKCCD4356]NNV10447.1 protein-export chaperone SecB [Roseobacter sp. HKCCD7357]NNV14632.1 protein-export chaperone SecB [Roseobacter sp. HKCCD8768]NNV24091.1 protein-export chaperone SecB [Roseobacter sp. HKCCD8192]NNV28348.1 protein-export chaperone SecB [Roseobacter sp. HKCCD9061]